MSPYRAGVTGSRDWYRPGIIREWARGVLAGHPDAVLISGHASGGADMLAEREWAQLAGYRNAGEAAAAGRIERHAADWTRHGKQAGFIRNAEMVASGADEWAAFVRPCTKQDCRTPGTHDSHGTEHCARIAEEAGIPVKRYSYWSQWGS